MKSTLNRPASDSIYISTKPLYDKQYAFVSALNMISEIIDSSGLPRNSWMVIAGGGVFLYQLLESANKPDIMIDRVPTDLDIIIYDFVKERSILEILQEALFVRGIESSLIPGPIEHFGCVLRGPTLKVIVGDFDVDIITELSQSYPPNHKFMPCTQYFYPPAKKMLEMAVSVSHSLIMGNVNIAHPGFIAFYKLMLDRNEKGKQDKLDLIRLKELGLLNPSKEMHIVLNDMCYENLHLFNAIKMAIAELNPSQPQLSTDVRHR